MIVPWGPELDDEQLQRVLLMCGLDCARRRFEQRDLKPGPVSVLVEARAELQAMHLQRDYSCRCGRPHCATCGEVAPCRRDVRRAGDRFARRSFERREYAQHRLWDDPKESER